MEQEMKPHIIPYVDMQHAMDKERMRFVKR